MSTKLQKLAQRENFAIYLLKGIKTKAYWFRGLIPQATVDRLTNFCDDAIAIIKFNQSERKNRQ